MGTGPNIATIGDYEISEAVLERETERERRKLLFQVGEDFDPNSIDRLQLRNYALEQLITKEVLFQTAENLNIKVLADALIDLLGVGEHPIEVIGTRHGEKLYESLISREEMSKAEDAGDYFRIPADNRDLNYAKYFTQGEESISEFSDYTSHNTEQLDQSELIDLLSHLEIIKEKVSA